MRGGRSTLGAFTAMVAIALACGAPAVAQEKYPDKPITFIVAWPAGGGSDVSMRLVADAASKKLGTSVVVVNKPGAGGALGHKDIASARPDGYTIGMFSNGGIAAQYNNPNANTIDELQPIAFFGEDPGAISARVETGFKTVPDLITAAKASPGRIKNGNDQPGGSSFIAIAVYEKAFGIKVTRVPYQGFAPTVVGLLSGEVDVATVPVPDIIEHHKSGKARILGVAATERHFMAPDVPTFKEQGLDVLYGSWRSIAGPRGMPADRLKFLEAKFLETLRDPEFVARAKAAGFAVAPLGIDDTWKRWKADDVAYYPILKEAGLVKVREKN